MTPHQQLALKSRIVYRTAVLLKAGNLSPRERRLRRDYHLEANDLRWPGIREVIIKLANEK